VTTHNSGRPSREELVALVEEGEIDTIIVAITDMQGRLQVTSRRFLLLRRIGRRRRRGLQLPSRLRCRHAHG